MPATKAKATASGTKARATVKPENTSSLMFPLRFSINLNFKWIVFEGFRNQRAKVQSFI